MKYRFLGVALAGVAAAALIGVTATSQTANNASVATKVSAADKAENFRLVDNKSKSHELFYFKDAKAVVLISHKVGSKHVAAAADAIAKIQTDYADKGVEVFLLNSSPTDTREAINADLAAMNLDVRVLMDSTQLIGESLGVTHEAEVFVIEPDQAWKVAYNGPIDDRFSGKNPRANAKVKTSYAADALDALVAGNAVTISTAKLNSPVLDFPARAKADEFVNISYSETIAPLVAKNCAACHAENGIAPFALNSYEQVKGFAPMMREAIRTDRMPPYNADPHMGPYKADMNLTPEAAKTLVHWIEAGAPRGEGPDILKINAKPAPEWELGEPDMIINVPAFTIPASGIVDYQNPMLENPLTEGRWLRASTVNVGERQGVHHLLSPVGGYAVGAETTKYQDDTGVWIEPGQPLRAQLHYTPFGKEAVDETRIGLYFYPKGEEPTLVRRSAVIANPGIEIPAGEARHQETAYITFPSDATLFTVYPHAHYRGENMEISLQRPGETEDTMILSLPKYDFNWQRGYEFATPLDLPAGTKLITRYEYDNSARNPANPDPTANVTWGDQSFQEMQYTALGFRWNDETAKDQKPEHMEALNNSRMIGMLDSNIDGKIEKAELRGRIGGTVKAQFERLDLDKDGILSAKEFSVVANMMGRRVREAATDGVASN